MAPVAVPIAAIRNCGSQANAEGLLGNPCCTVWRTEEQITLIYKRQLIRERNYYKEVLHTLLKENKSFCNFCLSAECCWDFPRTNFHIFVISLHKR